MVNFWAFKSVDTLVKLNQNIYWLLQFLKHVNDAAQKNVALIF